MKTEIITADADEEPVGPPLPFGDYVVWTRQVTMQLNQMAQLYEAIAADGDVESRVPQWSDACFELEQAYKEALQTPRPSAEICRQLAQGHLVELQQAIERAEAAEQAATGLEGEIHIFIDYGRKLRSRFSGEDVRSDVEPESDGS